MKCPHGLMHSREMGLYCSRCYATEESRDVRGAAIRAAAELRHAYREKQDWELVSRAIEILERATSEDET